MNHKERTDLRYENKAKLAHKLRGEGLTVGEVATKLGVDRNKVRGLQLLGERLAQVGES